MGPPMHWGMIGETLRRIILRHFAVVRFPGPVNDNDREA